MLLLLAACADPDPTEPGATGCEPILVEQQCTIWRCWTVRDDGLVAYVYSSDHQESSECFGPEQCCIDETRVANQSCGTDWDEAVCSG